MDTIKLPPQTELIIDDRVRNFVAKQIPSLESYDRSIGANRVYDVARCEQIQAILNWAQTSPAFRSEKTGDSYLQAKTGLHYLYGMTDEQIEAELNAQVEMRKRTAGRRAAVKKYGAGFVSAKIGRKVNQG